MRRYTYMFELIAAALITLALWYVFYKEKREHKGKMPFSIRKDS